MMNYGQLMFLKQNKNIAVNKPDAIEVADLAAKYAEFVKARMADCCPEGAYMPIDPMEWEALMYFAERQFNLERREANK